MAARTKSAKKTKAPAVKAAKVAKPRTAKTEPAAKAPGAAKTTAKRSAKVAPAIGAIAVGDPAPGFALTAGDGRTVRLSDFAGKRLVIYFYPKDDTPGCTVEACGFQAHLAALRAAGAEVVGVSRDSTASHQRFAAKHGLEFPLLSDPDATMIGAYASFGEKKFMGRVSQGILRTTVIVDRDGRVARRFPKVNTKTHAAEVLAALAELGS